MTKEPTVNRNDSENFLPEIKRRKRKMMGEHALDNVSYQSLFDLYVRECKLKNLSETTISGYVYATRYFLDFAGYDLMCNDVTQDLINEYCLKLQTCHKATTINSYVFKISPTVKYNVHACQDTNLEILSYEL
ncbi:phage integrase N-terminal SAM-like domain-containing protein, partial [Aminipila sp.]|uniref:phage integrase N-terminal SAM-like domain-containing protein n=1 Tax=Aminipila sp. TaxID=2060095 RepID=UPI00289E2CDB